MADNDFSGARILAGILLGVSPLGISAAPFPAHDPVTMALGGTGVATAPASHPRSILNPANLAIPPPEATPLPQHGVYIGGRVHDPDNLIDRVNSFQDSGVVGRTRASIETTREALKVSDAFRDAVGSWILTKGKSTVEIPQDIRSSLDDLINNTEQLRDGLELLEERPALGEGGGGVVAVQRADPGFGYAVSVDHTSWVRAEAIFNDYFLYDALEDLEAIHQLLGQEELGEAEWETARELLERNWTAVDLNLQEGKIDTSLSVDDLDSEVRIRGISITDIGVSLAREFRFQGHEVALGITPKLQQVYTYDYRKVAHKAEQWDFYKEPYRRCELLANADLGVSLPVTEHWRLGGAVRNILPYDLPTVTSDTMKLRPQARLGIAFRGRNLQAAVDAELNEVNPLDDGYGAQFAGMGLTLPLTAQTDLRFGYRHDLSNQDRHVGSIGLGRIFADAVSVDIAITANRHELGGALSLAW